MEAYRLSLPDGDFHQVMVGSKVLMHHRNELMLEGLRHDGGENAVRVLGKGVAAAATFRYLKGALNCLLHILQSGQAQAPLWL